MSKKEKEVMVRMRRFYAMPATKYRYQLIVQAVNFFDYQRRFNLIQETVAEFVPA